MIIKDAQYWDSNETIGPQPPCASGDLDNETGLMEYSHEQIADQASMESQNVSKKTNADKGCTE